MSKIVGNSYDDADNRFVKAINRIEGEICDQRMSGGRCVDEYVREKGGIQYGAATIETIAQHPDIQVCAETLRRWWRYYRLYKDLGNEIKRVYPKARARDYYELSRLLDAVILTKEGESREDACRRTILEAAGWISQKRENGRISCDDVRAVVGKVIDASSAEGVLKSKNRAEKPDRASKVVKTIAFRDIESAVDYLSNFSDPGHLGAGAVPVAAIGKQFNRLVDAIVRLADHLAREGDREEVREKIRFVRRRLDEIEAALEPTSSTWGADSDTGVKMGVP